MQCTKNTQDLSITKEHFVYRTLFSKKKKKKKKKDRRSRVVFKSVELKKKKLAQYGNVAFCRVKPHLFKTTIFCEKTAKI